MSNEINLLNKTKIQRNSSQKKSVKILRAISLVLLTFTVFCSLTLFFVSTRSTLSDLRAEESRGIENLQKQSSLLAKYLLIKERAGKLDPILSKRINLDRTIEQLQGQIPVDVIIDSLSVDQKNISVALTSQSVLALNKVIDDISLRNTKNTYKTIIIDGITYDKLKNNYLLAIKIGLHE